MNLLVETLSTAQQGQSENTLLCVLGFIVVLLVVLATWGKSIEKTNKENAEWEAAAKREIKLKRQEEQRLAEMQAREIAKLINPEIKNIVITKDTPVFWCEHCHGKTYNDKLGHCIACGAPRE